MSNEIQSSTISIQNIEKVDEYLPLILDLGIPINIVGQRQDTYPLVQKVFDQLFVKKSLREKVIFIDGTYKYPFKVDKKYSLVKVKPETLENKDQAYSILNRHSPYKLIILDPTKDQLPMVDHLLATNQLNLWTQRTKEFYQPKDKNVVRILLEKGGAKMEFTSEVILENSIKLAKQINKTKQ